MTYALQGLAIIAVGCPLTAFMFVRWFKWQDDMKRVLGHP